MRKLVAIMSLSVLAIAPLVSHAADKLATVTLDVSNMTCELCPLTVKNALKSVQGVATADADLATKTAVVHFDPTVTNPSALIQATTNAGYPSTLKK